MSLNFGARILAVAVVALLSASPSWARVGVASVVDGEPKGLPPAGTERVLHVGNDMQPNERVTTGSNDKAHIVFLDGSSLTVGPHSVVTIDKFVYDPGRKTGELALNASRGVFRFVGGAISKNSEVTVKTPSAIMGIRGGILNFAISGNGATTANFLFGGSLTITSQGVTQTTTQPGSQIVTPMGGPPTSPAPIPPGGLGFANFFQQNSGPGQQGGGGPGNPAIGAAFRNSGLSRANSAIPPATALAAVPATQQAQLKTGGVPGTQFAANNPLQGANPLQGNSTLQNVNPLQSANLLQGATPILQGATPIQAVGPLPPPTGLAAVPQPPFGPVVAVGPMLPASPLGTIGTMNQLLEGLLAGPNAPSPEILAILVNVLTPPPPTSDPPPLPPIPVSSPTPNPMPPTIFTPPGPGPQPPPTLPPTVYGSPCQSQVSQSNC